MVCINHFRFNSIQYIWTTELDWRTDESLERYWNMDQAVKIHQSNTYFQFPHVGRNTNKEKTYRNFFAHAVSNTGTIYYQAAFRHTPLVYTAFTNTMAMSNKHNH